MTRPTLTGRFAAAVAWFGIVTQLLLVGVNLLNIFSVAVTVAAMYRGVRVLRQQAEGAVQRFVVALVTGAGPMALSLLAGSYDSFIFSLVSWLSILLAWLVTQRVVAQQRRTWAVHHRLAADPERHTEPDDGHRDPPSQPPPPAPR